MPNLILYVVVLFVVAAAFRVDFFFYVLYFIFGVQLLARVWVDQALKRVTYRFDYPQRVFVGERATVRIQLTSKTALPLPWLRLHESTPVSLRRAEAFEGVMVLRPYERRDFEYELDCRQRGYYTLGPLTLESGDLFGLQRSRQREAQERVLLVYPRVLPLSQLGLPAQSPFGSIPVKERLYEDPTRLIGVRDYVRGDSFRKIHWRTSAAQGKLQVKRFEPAISIEALVVLNLRQEDYGIARFYTASELGITTAASIAAHLVSARQTVGLACNALDPLSGQESFLGLDPGRGQGHLLQLLDILARVRLCHSLSFVETVRKASLGLTWGATVIIITPDVDDELFSLLLWLKQRGLHLVLLVTDPQQAFRQVQQRAAQVNISALLVWQESDLDMWRKDERL